MKKLFFMMALVLSATGCGALRINPKSCKTDAVWGLSPNAVRGITREEQEEDRVVDIKAKEQFFVFYDRDIRLRDLLSEHGIKCEEVKKLRLVMSTSWFFWREVSLKVVKQ